MSAPTAALSSRRRRQSGHIGSDGIRPVIRLARAGEHTGEAQKKCSSVVPSPWSRSSAGVCSSGILGPVAQAP